MRITKINLVGLERDRDQLWAEAVYLYKQGAKWHPEEQELKDLIKVEQEQRFDVDVWEPIIEEWLEGRDIVTSSQILTGALRITIDKQDRRTQTRVSAIMTRLPWEHTTKRVSWSEGMYYLDPKGRPTKVYVRAGITLPAVREYPVTGNEPISKPS